jgi:L-aminopeptidase/D-esterase-like protein
MPGNQAPPMHNDISDVPGVAIGHSGSDTLLSGVTACLFSQPATAGVAVLGGAPAARDIENLDPSAAVDHVDAITLSGGSGFGLDAGGGVQAWLREQGRGFPVGSGLVPIVPTAIVFDLANGGNKDWGRFAPYRDLGYAAAAAANDGPVVLGSVGAGLGATTVNLKGGIGSASAVTSFGARVGALMVVNALGSATIGDSAHFWAAALEQGNEFGGRGLPKHIDEAGRLPRWKGGPSPAAVPHATTIGIVATDATLTKAEAERLAIAGHDGFARALRVTHALFDGDTLFAASTKRRPAPATPAETIELGIVAADCVARAIGRGVYSATNPGAGYAGPPAYGDLHGWQTVN